MKNRITLVIASLLLGLCIAQKEARVKDVVNVNVEKVYNLPTESGKLAQSAGYSEGKEVKTAEPGSAPYLEIAALDSASQAVSGPGTMNHNLLNIATTGRVLLNN